MSADPNPYYATMPSHRATLVGLYHSMHGCPPAPDEDLSAQARYLKFIVPSPDQLDLVAQQLADVQEVSHE